MDSRVKLFCTESFRLYEEAATLPSNSALLFEWKGVLPFSISKRITPIDQMSAL